ncbi:MAG: hypothetical protein AAF682_06840 [Planctomycetota bacterium]
MRPLSPWIFLALAASLSSASSAQSSEASRDALLAARAATSHLAYRNVAPVRGVVTPQMVNTGGLRDVVFEGHDLTVAADGGTKILYAPSELDDPFYRAAISTAAGGATVDYFDARVATPDVPTLLQYDAVHTWSNFTYSNPVAFGDNLANYADSGGNVVLGVFCTYTNGNSLDGTIMTSGYSPVVSPTGGNHFSFDVDAGPFFSCIATAVQSVSSSFRDVLILQGPGIIDSKFDGDEEIVSAYRVSPSLGSGEVVYVNGAGGQPLTPGGDWPLMVANAALCNPGQVGATPSCTTRLGVLGLNPNDFTCINNPIVAQTWQVNVSTTPAVGTQTTSTTVLVGLGGPTSGVVVLGYELLVLPNYVEIGPALGTHNIPVPPIADFIGAQFPVQAARVEANPAAVVLTNALDVTVGL